jgi:hypothetical protein
MVPYISAFKLSFRAFSFVVNVLNASIDKYIPQK